MRTKNSIYNSISSMISNFIIILIGFISQTIFVKTLGNEYLGLNGLLSNVISMLSIVELGFGSALIFELYKPVAINDRDTIKSLMKFYKLSYRVIAFIIFAIGLVILPFLNGIVGNHNISENIEIVYLLFLIDVVCSYLLSYKRSIIMANQKDYCINIIHIGYFIILNGLQIYVLLKYRNYYIYLINKILMRILENIAITIVANKKYRYILDSDVKPIDKKILDDIIIKIKALVFHKIGGFLVLGTDNVLISKFFGLNAVGLYSNYCLLITAVSNLISQIFNSITSSVGNLIVETDIEKKYEVYKKIRFINVWIIIFSCCSLLICINPFITIWLGEKYLLSFDIIVVLVINFYLSGTICTYGIFFNAAGIFHENRHVPLLESFVNIIFSVVFAKLFGLIGIFMGTLLSRLVVHFYNHPKYLYNYLFHKSYFLYLKDFFKYFMMFVFCSFIVYFVSEYIVINNIYMRLIVNLCCCIIIPNLIMLLIYFKTKEFIYFKDMFFKLFNSKMYKFKKM